MFWPHPLKTKPFGRCRQKKTASGNVRIANFQQCQCRACKLLQFVELLEDRGEAVRNLRVDRSGRVSIDCAAKYASWSQNGMDKSEAIEGGYSNT